MVMESTNGKGFGRRPTDEKRVGKNWAPAFGVRVCPDCGEAKCPKANIRSMACGNNQEATICQYCRQPENEPHMVSCPAYLNSL